jgi:hypothetical protein
MKNQCSTQQLSFNFEFEQVSTAPVEVKKENIVQQPKPVAKQPVKKAPHFTKADFEEILAVENDLINGRGAWLYSQLEKELARERKRAQAERQFEALRAESYKYNF